MLAKIKTIIQTLMAVFVILFFGGIWYTVSAEKDEALHAKQELEIQEVVETLEAITTHTLPNFERANNQTFIHSTVACVDYIYNTTSDIYPVNLELLVAQAALLDKQFRTLYMPMGRSSQDVESSEGGLSEKTLSTDDLNLIDSDELTLILNEVADLKTRLGLLSSGILINLLFKLFL